MLSDRVILHAPPARQLRSYFRGRTDLEADGGRADVRMIREHPSDETHSHDEPSRALLWLFARWPEGFLMSLCATPLCTRHDRVASLTAENVSGSHGDGVRQTG